MKLLTEEIKKRLEEFPLYSQEGLEGKTIILCKFFAPVCPFTWYVTEGEKVGNDYRFFGLVINNYFEKEWGYFMLSELESIRFSGGLGIERDIYFEECKIKDLNLNLFDENLI